MCGGEVTLGIGQAIDAGDLALGFVRRTDLMRVFGDRVAAADFAEATRVIEYETSTLGGGGAESAVVTRDLPVQ